MYVPKTVEIGIFACAFFVARPSARCEEAHMAHIRHSGPSGEESHTAQSEFVLLEILRYAQNDKRGQKNPPAGIPAGDGCVRHPI